ncbi:hypothetical protein GCM10010218_36530 [Streptomyces mashuensis]|uniref:Gram-positive cocci surface proteins LPxTG domain-containing protein n=1 Tax=Streptomyces mashuensis TaxID=33904 RepID=A0A919EDW6_9ACTN|nr:hypothetical protein [Streptomyces mashuensis]GHF51604.1 hypothetical protein GCM10010218_36530 [Streptomyces mashuensis]
MNGTTWRSRGLGLAAAALLGVAMAAPAHAAARGPLDIPDYQAALDLVKADATHQAVCRFLSVPVPSGGARTPQAIPDKADPCEGLPAITLKDPVAVYELTPDFIAGKAKPVLAEALRLAHLAAQVGTGNNGRTATVALGITKGGGWHLAAVREGDTGATTPAKGTLATPVFYEPQLHAWYQLKLDTVQALNAAAKAGLGDKDSLSLADYQNLVKGRYGDKLPGSDYDTKGFSSGYHAAAPAAGAGGGSTVPLVAGGSGAALALTGGALVLRRRRRAE